MNRKIIIFSLILLWATNACALDKLFSRDDTTGQTKYSNTITGATKIYWRDSAIYTWSSADGWFNIVADAGVEINSLTLNTTDFYIAGSISGKIIYTPSATQNITAAVDTVLANATVVMLNPDGDYALTSTPTIADGTIGQILYITCPNGEANTVTFQDQDTIPNSNIQLGAAGRAVGDHHILTLMFTGGEWVEVSYQ